MMMEEINVFAPIGNEEDVLELKPIFTVDQLLDQYNDNMSLHKQFGDEEYLLTANEVMVQLKTKQYII